MNRKTTPDEPLENRRRRRPRGPVKPADKPPLTLVAAENGRALPELSIDTRIRLLEALQGQRYEDEIFSDPDVMAHMPHGQEKYLQSLDEDLPQMTRLQHERFMRAFMNMGRSQARVQRDVTIESESSARENGEGWSR